MKLASATPEISFGTVSSKMDILAYLHDVDVDLPYSRFNVQKDRSPNMREDLAVRELVASRVLSLSLERGVMKKRIRSK